MKRLIVAFITLAVGLGAVHLAGGEPVERQQWPDNSPLALSDAVVDRFLSREEPPLVSYRAVRAIRASNRRFHVSGELEVETEFSLDSGLRYRVARESGSELIRNRALRAVLREEQAIWQRREQDSAAVSSQNYRFGFPKGPVRDGTADGLVVVPIRPRRRDRLLVDGAIALTPEGDLRTISGRLAKAPSWWTNRVEVVREYGSWRASACLWSRGRRLTCGWWACPSSRWCTAMNRSTASRLGVS